MKYLTLGDLTLPVQNIQWANQTKKYIDLTSVDRDSKKIIQTTEINGSNAPSRAKQIVKDQDVLFATTRPTQMRSCIVTPEYEEDVCSTGFCVLRPKTNEISPSFLFHSLNTNSFFKYVLRKQSEGNYPAVSNSIVKKYKIPVPPLAVQNEIVAVLDKYDELIRTLEEEVKLREEELFILTRSVFKQADGEIKNIGSCFRTVAVPGKVKTNDYLESGEIPIIDQGQKFIAGYTNNTKLMLPKDDYVLFGDHTREIKYADFSFAQGADGLKVFKGANGILPKYGYFALRSLNIPNRGYSRHWSLVKKLEIPVPTLEEQQRIVSILDTLSDYIRTLKEEISLRKEQFDLLRNQLLTFEEE